MSILKSPKVITIVGPTASGKTSLSIALAKQFNGEIISADSRQVYRGMDLGTGKVTVEETGGIPHHLIDIADPVTDIYTAAEFKSDASKVLSEIHARGSLPIIAGGTFFYIDVLKGDMSIPSVPPNQILRQELEVKSPEELTTILQGLDQASAARIDISNPRRLVRAIEIATALGHVPPTNTLLSPYEFLTLGIDIDLETLLPRIITRLHERLELGMIEEVERLHLAGVSWEKMDSFGLEYRYIARYLQGFLTLEAMTEELAIKIRQFAKRQLTWLKRDKNIIWLPFPTNITVATDIVDTFLKQ